MFHTTGRHIRYENLYTRDTSLMLEAFVADALGLLKVPLAGTTAKSIASVSGMIINKKVQERRDILIEELKKGNLPIEKMVDDEFVSSLWRIHMAIIQGAGVRNVRLLAKVLLGFEASSNSIYADQFLRYAQILETLSYEEIRILGMFAKELLEVCPLTDLALGKLDHPKLRGLCFNYLRKYVEAGGNGYEYGGHCASLLRTGLLIPIPGLGDVTYVPSPLLAQLINIIQGNIDCVLD